jgi:hypothetical protein
MRTSITIFRIIFGFFVVTAVVYTIWNLTPSGGVNYRGGGRVEWVGTVGLVLCAVLAIFIAFYLSRSYHSQGGQLPEDRLDASIDDGDPEMGFFSPWSWWPLILAAAAGLLFLGLAIGQWIIFFGGGLLIIALVGWVYEYYRRLFAH